MSGSTIVVAGALANKPGNGGEAWVRLSWVRGFLLLGFDVWFVEELSSPVSGDIGESIEAAWFTSIVGRFGLAGRAILVGPDSVLGATDIGVVKALLGRAELLVNISGNLRRGDLLGLARRAAYVDLDPGFTQIWHAQGVGDLRLEAHHLHFTVGENIGTSRCPLPTSGLHWQPCRQPVLLEDWPVTHLPDDGAFTTVATWRCPFGPVEWAGQTYGLKVHEFRKVIDLPMRSAARLELALSMHDSDAAERDQLAASGWTVCEAASVANSPEAFRRYVQGSAGEFSVAQGVYAHARTGWMSDRSLRYLASGRPVVVQDTGVDEALNEGRGLLTFHDVEGAVSALEAVLSSPEVHARAARRLAEDHFEARQVLTEFLRRCEVLG